MTTEWYPKIWKDRSIGPYARVGNFEKLGIPLLLHTLPRFGKANGDKIEIMQAGDKRISEMVGWVREVYDYDVADSAILRLDLTADTKMAPVDWFRRHVRIAMKQTHRTHLTAALEVSKREAETIYGGIAPCQYRIYNKTLHRHDRLLVEHNRKRKIDGLGKQTFEEVFGYDPCLMVTRVERQMGAREPAKAFGIKFFGEINAAANIDPFTNMIFPHVRKPDFGALKPLEAMAVSYLRGFMDEANDGLQNARNQMKRFYMREARTERERETARRTFNRKWAQLSAYLHDSDQAYQLTRERLTDEYKATTMVQLAA